MNAYGSKYLFTSWKRQGCAGMNPKPDIPDIYIRGGMNMDIASACLCGINCKYSGGNNFNPGVYKKMIEGKVIPVCPEVLGGLPTPRIPAEITGDRVINKSGKDITDDFLRGAFKTLEIAKAVGADRAVFKQRSPSCGCGQIYDGSFSGKVVEGDGIATRILKQHGIRVISEEDL